jgi:hypothetical protein
LQQISQKIRRAFGKAKDFIDKFFDERLILSDAFMVHSFLVDEQGAIVIAVCDKTSRVQLRNFVRKRTRDDWKVVAASGKNAGANRAGSSAR